MISAVGFDLGGTLMDYSGIPFSWEREYPAALAAVASLWGARPSTLQLARAMEVLREFNSRIHPRDREVDHLVVFGRLLEAMDAPPSNRLDLVEQAVDAFFAVFRRWVAAIPGADAIIAGLRRAGMPFGVLTDVPYGMPRRVLLSHVEAAGLAVPQSTLLSSVDVGTRKPNPEGFRRLAATLGCSTDETLFMGDEEKDMSGALAAGMPAVLFWKGEDEAPQWGQQHTIGELGALCPILCLVEER